MLRVCFLWSRGSIHARSGVAPRHALCVPGDGLRFSVSGTEGALYTPRHKALRRPSKTVSRSYFFFFSRGEDGSLERCVSFPKLLNSWRKTVHIRSHLMLPVTPGPWRTREVNLPKTPKVAQPGRGPGRLGSGGGVPPPHSSDFPIEPPGVTCVSDERRRGHRPPGPQGVTGHGA